MIRSLDRSVWRARAQFLDSIRRFFREAGVLEVETPLLNARGTVEPFLDPFRVSRTGARPGSSTGIETKPTEGGTRSESGAGEGYLITSPEYNLKALLSQLQQDLFQIAHCFRSGDAGGLHTEEFLMLEWYRIGFDEFDLMDEAEALLRCVWQDLQAQSPQAAGPTPVARAWSEAHGKAPPWQESKRERVADLFAHYCNCSLQRGDLERAVHEQGLLGTGESARDLRYEELFFSLFLNRIEPTLGRSGPHFVYDYPPELAALATVSEGRARRFELYWSGVELANGYYELQSPAEQARRFADENRLRARLGKPRMQPEEQLSASLERGLPQCSGIALGLDRLFMLLWGAESLESVSPFPESATAIFEDAPPAARLFSACGAEERLPADAGDARARACD